MGLGRRARKLQDASAWVFNRMADAYEARPPYPTALVDALAALTVPQGRIGDVGAGIGHLALPLSARGFAVTAIEPAAAMLDSLRRRALARGEVVSTVAATAEAMPLPAASLDLVVVADALHFLDAELAGVEIARVLAPQGTLAVVSSEWSDTPFMHSVVRIMEQSAPRRPRATAAAANQLAALCDIQLGPERCFADATALDADTLTEILRSISFIGPAMNAVRWDAFQTAVRAIAEPAVWARTFRLRAGSRARTRGQRGDHS
jgi:ubiquinone/menaquinone biosynthesis C-methylase UbiE